MIAISHIFRKSILEWQLLPRASSCFILYMMFVLSSSFTVNLRMTRSVLTAATLKDSTGKQSVRQEMETPTKLIDMPDST